MSSNAKDIRKQIKNVIQSDLESIVSEELVAKLEQRLMAHLDSRLNVIEEKQKQIQSFLLRQTTLPVAK